MKEEIISIETVVSKMLIEKNLTISTAESCTGGLVSATLINYPGISSVFMEGCVTYSNESKINRLGVNPNTLKIHGAVSEETAREMAEGIAKNFDTNVAISTTGIAGPGGGTIDKPARRILAGDMHRSGRCVRCGRIETRIDPLNGNALYLLDGLRGPW